MQLRPRSKSRGRSMARTASSMRSRSTRSRARSVSRFSSRSRSSNGSVRGFGNDVQMSFKKKGPNVSAKKKGIKKVKVPPKFRKQVNQVLKQVSPSGNVSEVYMFKHIPLAFSQQQVVNLGGGWDPLVPNFTDQNRLMFFDPCRVLDAASVLFNGKTFSGSKSLGNTGLFAAKNFQCEVLSQNVGFEIKNNSARRFTIKLWTWKLKGNLRLTADFTGYWNAAINEESVITDDGYLNRYSSSSNVIGMNPKFSPRMNEMFQIEEKVINLEAGKQTYHQINGYRGLYDFSKFWDGLNFNNYNKNCMGVCMAFYPDLIGTDGIAGDVSRTTQINPSSGFGLLVETRCHYTIRVPEQAGFSITVPAGGSTQQVSLKQRRHHPYAIKFNPGPIGLIGNVSLINDENPESKADEGI